MNGVVEEKYYSICCGVRIPDYPDNDFCPKCKDHTGAITEEEMEKEEGEGGRLLK